ncbi:MAG: PhoH family protein [Acidobacteriia bacterium]|nr:PhoH family protein [Terriglobia bacterium]
MEPIDVYIPDTSALVENPEALDRLLRPGNLVVLLHQVLEELGRLQGSRTKSEGVRSAARAATRKILGYRNCALIHHSAERFLRGELGLEAFATTPTGGVLAWEPSSLATSGNGNGHGDNLIIQAARRIQAINNGNGRFRVVLISEDSNMLLRCDALGLAAEPLRFGKLDLNRPEEIFDGVSEIEVDPEVVQAFFESGPPRERSVPLALLADQVPQPVWNQGLVLRSGGRELLLRVDAGRDAACELRFAQYWDTKRECWTPRTVLGFTPGDARQVFALEFLLDPEVQLIVLDGPAGSGKTRLMVIAALYLLFGQPTNLKVHQRSQPLSGADPGFENGLILLRPEHSSSRFEMGYLPGDHDEKMSPWLEPFFQAIRSVALANGHDFLHDLESTERLTLLSTSLLRGLDIENSFVLVDELQNGDRHLAKTLMSRFCSSSKVVLAGCLDPIQIDNPYVDWRSNALTRIKQAYRGFGPFVAQVRLVRNYRGPISTKSDEL